MSSPLETIKKGKYVINIYPDDAIDSPRDWDNLGKIVGYCRDYTVYDEELKTLGNNGSYWKDFLEYIQLENNIIQDKEKYPKEFENLTDKEIKKLENWVSKNIVVLPVYAYIHGGIALSVGGYSCPWDSGQVGFIFATKEQILKDQNKKKLTKKLIEKVVDILTAEIKTFDDYCRGNVCYFEVIDEFNNMVNCCGGFYGYDNQKSGLLEYATNYIKADRKQKREIKKIAIMAM